MKTPLNRWSWVAGAAATILILVAINGLRKKADVAAVGDVADVAPGPPAVAPAARASGTQTNTGELRRTPANSGDWEPQSFIGKSSKDRQIVQISPHRVLATVNGAPIRLEHLAPMAFESREVSMASKSREVPMASGSREVSMASGSREVSMASESREVSRGSESREAPMASGGHEVNMERWTLHSRLQRAIEAELVFQEAEAKGVGLTESQQKRLDQIGPVHEADLEELKPFGLSWDSLNEEQVDFERRTTEAMLLRQNLVAASNAVAPSPDRAVQARYEDALQKLLGKLKSEADIEDRSSELPAAPELSASGAAAKP